MQDMTQANGTRSGHEDRWHSLADRVLAGEAIGVEDGLAILECPEDELLDLLAATFRVRRHHFGRTVQLYFLMNAKSGLCPEDCGYCSQSKVSDAEIPKYNLLDRETLLAGAAAAAERKARTYCMVISARSPSQREIQTLMDVIPEIKQRHGLKICVSLGLLDASQARQLADGGVDRVNHNLNSSESFYGEICTTHTYGDRVSTLHSVRDAGMELCAGGILGMGESTRDRVDMAIALRELGAESIPINFLNPIEGTALAEQRTLTPRDCLRGLCLFRLANPTSEIRIAGGRELHLRSLQPLGLYAANSIFVGDYLTTAGQPPDEDYQMLRDLGFEIVQQDEARR